MDQKVPREARHREHGVQAADIRGMGTEWSLRTDKVDKSSWLAGYCAAIGDALAEVDSLSGPCNHSLSAPVLLRVRDRLSRLAECARDAVA